jgi:hypothetical protein
MKSIRLFWFVLLLISLPLLSACANKNSSLPTPLPGTQPPSDVIATQVNQQYQNLAEAQARWQAQKPQSYRLTIRTVSLWNIQTISLQVENDKVLQSSAECEPAPLQPAACQVAPYVAEDYTIPALFAKIQSAITYPGSENLTVDYDATLGYPFRIAFDDPQAIDEEWLWQVIDFQK